MSNNIDVKVHATAKGGVSIDMAIQDVLDYASDLGDIDIYLEFNGTEVIVRRKDDPQDVLRTWNALRTQDQRRRGIS